jgi:hypothetical protein
MSIAKLFMGNDTYKGLYVVDGSITSMVLYGIRAYPKIILL